MSKLPARAVLCLAAAFFAAFFAWPVLQILKGGFLDPNGHFTVGYVGALLADPLYLAGLRNSFLIASASTVLAILIAVPLAFGADRFRFPGRSLFGSLLLVPMILPPFVGAIGIRELLGRTGALNALIVAAGLRPHGWSFDWLAASRFWGVVSVDALSLYPIVYLNVLAALANIDPSLEEAAQNLGCTGFRRFRRVTLPLVKPGLFAGGTIVFIWAFTDLGTPLVFDYARVASVQIYSGLRDIGGNPLPYALVAVTMAASALAYLVGKAFLGRSAFEMTSRATGAGGARALPRGQAWLWTAFCSAVTLCALLPHACVILVAFSRDWYGSVLPRELTLGNFQAALGHPLTVPAIANSLKFSSVSTVIDLVLGVSIAWVVTRTRVAGRHALDVLSMLPLAVPGLVLAFGYLAMAQPGRFFDFINPVENPTVLLIIAYSVRRLPYVVRSAVAGFEQTGTTLDEAAQSLGCPPFKAMLRITFPLIAANLIAGALLAFAFAMLEVSDSLILAAKQAYYPITKAILELFQLLGEGRYLACALGAWAMVFLGVAIVGMGMLLGKKLGVLFRV